MGSRIGSIAILIVIAGIVAAVVVVISRLDLLNTGEPDAPVMVVSLDEDELLLLNQPQSITVTISSGSPIATLELVVDEVQVAEVIPPYSQDRGAWIGSFVWTPDRLGFADVSIIALDANGVESVRQIRVEVTDDQARVAAALRVTVLGISPLQQFPAGAAVRIELSATGSQPIERFDMHIDGEHIVSVTPDLDNTGRYSAAIEWTHDRPGEVEVTITAVDVAGREESQTIPVVLTGAGVAVPSRDSNEQSETLQEDEQTPPAADETESQDSQARIDSPEDGQRFTLDSEFAFDVEVTARNVGAVASALLYLTPIAPDNTLGNSILIHSSEDHAPGDYSERVADVEQWITSSGAYELQLVVFTPEDERYDHRIVIHVVAVADDEQDLEEEEDEQPSDSDEIDLAIVTARQADDDRNRLNVSITNASSVDIERTDVVITVEDANSGDELASAAVTLGIEADDLRTIPLDLNLEPGADMEALVALEASVDTNAANNRLRITLRAPDESADEEEEQDALQEEEDQQDTTEKPDQEEQEQPGPSPDLTFLDAQATNDGYVLLTVINNGDGPAETFFIVVSNQAGEQLETITRRATDAQPLVPGGTEILTSLQPHSGVITITVLVGGDIAERNLGDNAMMLEIPD